MLQDDKMCYQSGKYGVVSKTIPEGEAPETKIDLIVEIAEILIEKQSIGHGASTNPSNAMLVGITSVIQCSNDVMAMLL